jgi:hypothetical protein
MFCDSLFFEKVVASTVQGIFNYSRWRKHCWNPAKSMMSSI